MGTLIAGWDNSGDKIVIPDIDRQQQRALRVFPILRWLGWLEPIGISSQRQPMMYDFPRVNADERGRSRRQS
ncbi:MULTISPECIES: hypothetical protein [unclassified Microcoleus]|uniref:hypothetical protein n=1 Tax=unclassified Microcoleus TaxID=2642155 RepID=UPI0025FE2D43|nr:MULTISPECIES: hypothetical protein [unclassified Microcoleus]